MPRSQRLLDLMQVLRRHRRPVSGAVLAEELGVSLRTLYRDIETLKAHGAHDRRRGRRRLRAAARLHAAAADVHRGGDRGAGARLALGVASAPTRRSGDAARNALAKIAAVLPDDLKESLDASSLLIGPGAPIAAGDAELASIRTAIRTERKLQIAYADDKGSDHQADDLAVRARLLRSRPRRRGVVRAAQRLSTASAPTASRRSSRPRSAIRAAATRCSRSGGGARAFPSNDRCNDC